jgi:putative peptidoglycan lipid II flippase
VDDERRDQPPEFDAVEGDLVTAIETVSLDGDQAADGLGREPILATTTAGSKVLSHSMTGAVWTGVSRVSGLVETIAVGAILGATYLGNTFQAINSIPNIVYYQLLAGSLFASLLVPPLVRHIDNGDKLRAQRLVKGFMGSMLLIALFASVLLLLLSPLVMRLLTLGVSNPEIAAAQSHVGRVLLVMFVPQIALYLIAGSGAAIMNAHGRFALASAAPALENAGLITMLVMVGVLFGTGTAITDVSKGELLLLGLGATGAVALHAGCQWLGSRSTGILLVPGAGWRDPEVRQVLRRIVPMLGYTGFAAAQIMAVFVVANRIPGGLVAFQLALNFFYLPAAIVTWPIARALLPHLSRLHNEGNDVGFREELSRGVILASFVTVPISVAYVVLSVPLARAITFGRLGTSSGVTMVALSLATVAIGVVGEAWFILGTYAFYARHDVHSPLRTMAVRTIVTIGLMVVAWQVHGPRLLAALGLALSAGSILGAAHVWIRLARRLPAGGPSLSRPLGRALASSLIMAVPAALVAVLLNRLLPSRQLSEVLAMAAASIVGLATYLGVQATLRAPELSWLKTGMGRSRVAGRHEG